MQKQLSFDIYDIVDMCVNKIMEHKRIITSFAYSFHYFYFLIQFHFEKHISKKHARIQHFIKRRKVEEKIQNVKNQRQ